MAALLANFDGPGLLWRPKAFPSLYGPIVHTRAVFSFLYLKKIKISKIYPGRPMGGRQGSNVIFFFFKFATKSLEKKKRGGPVARWGGDRSPMQIGTIASVLFFFRKFTTVMPFFSYVVLYLSDYYATFDI